MRVEWSWYAPCTIFETSLLRSRLTGLARNDRTREGEGDSGLREDKVRHSRDAGADDDLNRSRTRSDRGTSLSLGTLARLMWRKFRSCDSSETSFCWVILR